MAAFSNDQKTLLQLLAASLFGAQKPNGDLMSDSLWREAVQQGVYGLVIKDLDVSGMAEDLQNELRQTAKKTLATNLQIDRGHALMSELLEQNGIEHVIIKGLASALYYPAPELRQIGDVDFYVAPQSVERTEALLLENAFTPEKMSHSRHHVYIKDGCRFELHFELPGIPEGDAGDKCNSYFSTLLQESAVRKTPFGSVRLPSAFHHGLIILLHAAHHLLNSGVGLRHLCDWAVFTAGFTTEDFNRTFAVPLKETGLWNLACCLTDLCVRWLHCPAPVLPDAPDEALSDAVLSDMFMSGNLGQKDVVRSREAYLITAGRKKRSRLLRLLTVMADMLYQRWPLTKKIKILIPIGWAYFTVRYLIRAAMGKRPKLYAREAVRGAQERTELYDRLRLYEAAKEDV